jgi:hypothetical protein
MWSISVSRSNWFDRRRPTILRRPIAIDTPMEGCFPWCKIYVVASKGQKASLLGVERNKRRQGGGRAQMMMQRCSLEKGTMMAKIRWFSVGACFTSAVFSRGACSKTCWRLPQHAQLWPLIGLSCCVTHLLRYTDRPPALLVPALTSFEGRSPPKLVFQVPPPIDPSSLPGRPKTSPPSARSIRHPATFIAV